ncbi:GAF domain-containing protein [Streptomyces virginiae]
MRLAGLSAASDTGMDRFARLVSRLLRVPVAFVSLVEEKRQILPGLFGLPEPWAGSRALPLSHSLCRYVVASGQPLVVPDARADGRLRTNPALGDLGLIAYAGMPLIDADGLVLGSLCAIDHEPRTWGDGELTDLQDLAAACSAELCLPSCRRRAGPHRRCWRPHGPPPSVPAVTRSAWSRRPRPAWTMPSCC